MTKNLEEQENKFLQALALHQLSLQQATVDKVKPGTALYYKLGDDYGCHIVRGAEDLKQGFAYKDAAGLRAGVEAGNFYIIEHDSSTTGAAEAVS